MNNDLDLSLKRIMLTGGAGFLVSFVTEKLKAHGCKDIFLPKKSSASQVIKILRTVPYSAIDWHLNNLR